MIIIRFCYNFADELGIDDDVGRRDQLHAIINSLPDPNYATLRALILVCRKTSQNYLTVLT